MTAFMRAVAAKYDLPIADYATLYDWSVRQPEQFWCHLVWAYCGVIANDQGDLVLEHRDDRMPGPR